MKQAEVLKFPTGTSSSETEGADGEAGGGDGELPTYRLSCPNEGCGFMMFHVHMTMDPDNHCCREVWYNCANCGDQILIPD